MPASGDVLLDSSVIIPHLKGDPVLRDRFQASTTLYLPQTVLGELYCGAHLCDNPAKTLEQIQSFLVAVAVLSPGLVTAEHYGRIRAALSKRGDSNSRE